MEIVSYGGIPKSLTKEQFLAGKTEPVNPELMRIFMQCGIVEQSGHGVPIVVREYGKNAYTFSKNMITVTIPFHHPIPSLSKSGVENGVEKYSPKEKSVLQEIEKCPSISKSNIVKKTGIPKTTLDRIIDKLKRDGILVHQGPAKGGYWEIKSNKE